ncbi:MAG: Ada metal-binding domain-containing protein [Candidatus Paceibacterota bacterium]
MKKKARKKRLVKEIRFKMRNGQSLVIFLGLPVAGLERVIIENNNGVVEVSADSHSRFEFSDKKIDSNTCDFYLTNPTWNTALTDYLLSCFWSQFGWGDLARYQNDPALVRAVRKEIRKLVEEFEPMAAERLNKIVSTQKKRYKILRGGKIILSSNPGRYAGYEPRKIFGRLDCKSGKRMMKKKNRVFFLTWQDAIDAGYRPCKVCKPAPDDTHP